jgi:hypothetical protein
MTPRSKKPTSKRNPHAVALARLGAKKGADATNRKLSARQRSENARKAVKARWAKWRKEQAKKKRKTS